MAPVRLISHRPLTPEERRLVLRATALVAIPMALICFLSLFIGGTIAFVSARNAAHDAQDASKRTRQLTLVLNAQRAIQTRTNAWAIYDACVENENQDAVTADLLRKFRKQISQAMATTAAGRSAREASIEAIQTWLDAREPPDEKNCTIPPFPRPER